MDDIQHIFLVHLAFLLGHIHLEYILWNLGLDDDTVDMLDIWHLLLQFEILNICLCSRMTCDKKIVIPLPQGIMIFLDPLILLSEISWPPLF